MKKVMSKTYSSILKIVLQGRASGRILFATVLSFTFSITVILCTFGLMDGFDHLLKSGLRTSSGDVIITNRQGFFKPDEFLSSDNFLGARVVAPVLQTEAFALHEGKSKGVLLKGVDSSFAEATGLKVDISEGGITIGKELARALNLSAGDELALALGRGNESGEGLPSIRVFRVNKIVEHGIYQKDLRFLYIDRDILGEILGIHNKVNLILATYYPTNIPLQDLDGIKRQVARLRGNLDSIWRVKPFWDEYDFLIEAVKVEKFSISLILQLIVLVAIFNIVAFVIYVMEKKAQEFFFLRAVGLSLKNLMGFWFRSILVLWFISCIGAYALSHVFNWSLQNLPIFKVPGEIYVLSSLSVRLDFKGHATVYALSLMWILLAAFIGYFRMKKKPIIQGLRQEFS
jgi:ABC-type lipoprotein release transport system permease subunit